MCVKHVALVLILSGSTACSRCSEVFIDDATGGASDTTTAGGGNMGGSSTTVGTSSSGGAGGRGGDPAREAVVVTASLDGSVRVSCDDGYTWGPPFALRDGHPSDDFVHSFPWVHGLAHDEDAWVAMYSAWTEELEPTPSTPNWVRRSRDLVTWDPPVRFVDGKLTELVHGSDHFLTVGGNANELLRSTDGAIWVSLPAPMDDVGALRAVPDAGRIVVFGAASGVGVIRLSDDDGDSFRAPTALPAACAVGPSSFVSEGARGMIVISGAQSCATLDGGEHWTLGSLAPAFTPTIVYSSGGFVGWSDTDPYTSPDGLVWTERESNTVPVTPTAVGVSEAGTFVAMDFITFHAMRSTDGLSWTVFDFDIGHAAFNVFGSAPKATVCATARR